MRANESDAHKERFVTMHSNQLARFFRRSTIRMRKVTTLRLNDHKRVAADHGPLTIGIAFQGFTDTRRLPLRALAVESFGPRHGVIRPITSFLDVSRDAHVKYFADSSRVIS